MKLSLQKSLPPSNSVPENSAPTKAQTPPTPATVETAVEPPSSWSIMGLESVRSLFRPRVKEEAPPRQRIVRDPKPSYPLTPLHQPWGRGDWRPSFGPDQLKQVSDQGVQVAAEFYRSRYPEAIEPDGRFNLSKLNPAASMDKALPVVARLLQLQPKHFTISDLQSVLDRTNANDPTIRKAAVTAARAAGFDRTQAYLGDDTLASLRSPEVPDFFDPYVERHKIYPSQPRPLGDGTIEDFFPVLLLTDAQADRLITTQETLGGGKFAPTTELLMDELLDNYREKPSRPEPRDPQSLQGDLETLIARGRILPEEGVAFRELAERLHRNLGTQRIPANDEQFVDKFLGRTRKKEEPSPATRDVLDRLVDLARATPHFESPDPPAELRRQLQTANAPPNEMERFDQTVEALRSATQYLLTKDPSIMASGPGLCDEDLRLLAPRLDPILIEFFLRERVGTNGQPMPHKPLQHLQHLRAQPGEIFNPLQTIQVITRAAEVAKEHGDPFWSSIPCWDGITDYFKDDDPAAAAQCLRLALALNIPPSEMSWAGGTMTLEDVTSSKPLPPTLLAADPARAETFEARLDPDRLHPTIAREIDELRALSRAAAEARLAGRPPPQRTGAIVVGPPGVGKTSNVEQLVEARMAYLGAAGIQWLDPQARPGSNPSILGFIESLPKKEDGSTLFPANKIFVVDEAHNANDTEIRALMSLMGDDGLRNPTYLLGYPDRMQKLIEGGDGMTGDAGLARRIGRWLDLPPFTVDQVVGIVQRKLANLVPPDVAIAVDDIRARVLSDFGERLKSENAGLANLIANEIASDVLKVLANAGAGQAGAQVTVPRDAITGQPPQLTPAFTRIREALTQVEGMESSGGQLSQHLLEILNVGRKKRGYPPITPSGAVGAKSTPNTREVSPHVSVAFPAGYRIDDLANLYAQGLAELGLAVVPEAIFVGRNELVDGHVEGTPRLTKETLQKNRGRVIVIDVDAVLKGGNQADNAPNYGQEVVPALVDHLRNGGPNKPAAIMLVGTEDTLKEEVINTDMVGLLGVRTEVKPLSRDGIRRALEKRFRTAGIRLTQQNLGRVVRAMEEMQTLGQFRGPETLEIFQRKIEATDLPPAHGITRLMDGLTAYLGRNSGNLVTIPNTIIEEVCGEPAKVSHVAGLWDAVKARVSEIYGPNVRREWMRTAMIRQVDQDRQVLLEALAHWSALPATDRARFSLASLPEQSATAGVWLGTSVELRERVTSLLGIQATAYGMDPKKIPQLKGGQLVSVIQQSLDALVRTATHVDATTLTEAMGNPPRAQRKREETLRKEERKHQEQVRKEERKHQAQVRKEEHKLQAQVRKEEHKLQEQVRKEERKHQEQVRAKEQAQAQAGREPEPVIHGGVVREDGAAIPQ